MKVHWIRFNDNLDFDSPKTWFVMGQRGSGKSSLLERIAMEYLKRGNVVLDLFGSRDGENLAWLRSPYVEDHRVLLLHGKEIKVEHPKAESKCAFKLTLNDLENYDILISSPPLYSDLDEELEATSHVTDLLYKRLSWNRVVFMIVREASNLYYSRLKVSRNQTIAKTQMIYMLREARHCGVALGLDSLRYKAIDVDVRSLCDYVIVKSLGNQLLPDEMRWLYSYFYIHALHRLPKNAFVVLTHTGALGVGCFAMPPWHKEERENLLAKINLKITREEKPEPKEKGKVMIVEEWIEERCVESTNAMTKRDLLYKDFDSWAQENYGEKLLTAHQFYKVLKRLGYEGVKIHGTRHVIGLKLKREPPIIMEAGGKSKNHSL